MTVYGRKNSTRPHDSGRDPEVRTVETWGLEVKSLSTLSYGFFSVVHACWYRPDVALVMNVANGFWIPLLKLARIPTVVNVDGIEWERAKWGRVAKSIFKVGAKLTAWLADELIVDSIEIGRRWLSRYSRSGEFIPYGGDEPGDLPIPDGLKSGEFVLYVARLVPENSVQEFLEAARALAADWDIVIVGSSGYGGELEAAVSQLNDEYARVHWLGHVSDDQTLASLWQHAGAYFHGHSVGGTNPALVQAMACGAPVVALDTPYNREVLEGSGILTSLSALEIESALRGVLVDRVLQVRLSGLALKRARSAYTWDLVSGRYDAVLRLWSRNTAGLA